MNLTSSGVARNRIDRIMVWRATLFPDPVAPAIRRCGIFDRSRTTGSPKMSFPRASDSVASDSA
jgi:hypothetical protein